MSLFRTILAYDRAGLRPVGALLRFLGVALAVAGGGAAGGRGGAVLAGLGALYAGMASFGGVHPARLKRMVAATLAATATTFVGCLVGPSDLATIVAVFVGAFAFSLLAAAGPDAGQVGVQAVAILVVLSGVKGSNLFPLGNALLVMGGGLGQAAVLALFHPLSPVAAERRAVEAVYLGLARAARDRGRPLPPVEPHAKARDLIREGFGYDASPELRKLWIELELADALRGNVAGLSRAGAQEATWIALAEWFDASAEDVARGRPVERRSPPLGEDSSWARRIRRTVAAEGDGRLPTDVPAPRSWLAALRNVEAVAALARGHALRYAAAVGLATAVYRLLNVDHGYWAALAVAISLRPDYATTVVRGLGRIVGTALGVALATGLVAAFHPSAAGLTAAMLGAVWAAFALQGATYVGFSTGLAFYVVVSVTLSGMAVSTVGLERIAATAAGSALALAAALAWPRWEAGNVRQALAVAFAAQAEYAEAVLAFEGPDRIAGYRFQARSARLEAERIVAAAGFEPRWSRREHLDGAGAALARLAENAARILASHVAALDPHGDEPPEDLARLAAEDRGLAADLMG